MNRLSDRARPRGARYKRPSVQRPSGFWRAYQSGTELPPAEVATRLVPNQPVSLGSDPSRVYREDNPLDELVRPQTCLSREYRFTPPLNFSGIPPPLIKLGVGLVRAFRRRSIPMSISRLDGLNGAVALHYHGPRKLLLRENTLLHIEAFGAEVARAQNVKTEWYEPLIWKMRDV